MLLLLFITLYFHRHIIFALRLAAICFTVLYFAILCKVAPNYSRKNVSRYARTILDICGYELRIKGELNTSVGLLVANHCSILDGIVILAALDKADRTYNAIGYVSFVYKKAVENFFVMRWIVNTLNCVPVDRSATDSKTECKNMIRQRSVPRATAGKAIGDTSRAPLLIFAEGTTSTGNELLSFRNGAFEPLQNIQPITLKYEYLPPVLNSFLATRPPHLGYGAKGVNTFRSFYNTLTNLDVLRGMYKQVCTITFMSTVYADEYSNMKPETYRDMVRNTMARNLQVPMVDYIMKA